jgi:hypothetical protein
MKAEESQEALSRATGNVSTMNYLPIVEGFLAKGIPSEEILPRENIFTFKAWIAKGRVVNKGEKGVKVTTFVKDAKTGKSYPKHTTVFHISQTKELEKE